ncbi:hypothetical protein [Archangium violaceum]
MRWDGIGHFHPLVPVAQAPIAADQPMNAERCRELGVAHVVSPLSMMRG